SASEAPTRLASERSAAMRAPERSARSSFACCICAPKTLAAFRLAPLRSAPSSQVRSRIAPSSFAPTSLVLLSLATRSTTRERSSPDRSRPDSFLPLKSTGVPDFAAASTASTCARVISADVISGELTSTYRNMSSATAGTLSASKPNVSTHRVTAIMYGVLGPIVIHLVLCIERQYRGLFKLSRDSPGDSDGVCQRYDERPRLSAATMTLTPRLAIFNVVGTLAYLGLAVLGWGGFAAFFSYPALVVRAAATLVMSGVALFSSGNLCPSEREIALTAGSLSPSR